MTGNGPGASTTGAGELDLAVAPASADREWEIDPNAYWATVDAATHGLDAPILAADLAALRFNVADMRRRAAGKPIRVASKSIRSRPVLDALLRVPGYAGVLNPLYEREDAILLLGDARQTVGDLVAGLAAP